MWSLIVGILLLCSVHRLLMISSHQRKINGVAEAIIFVWWSNHIICSFFRVFVSILLLIVYFIDITAVVVLFSVVTLALGTLRAASAIHSQLLQNILQCSMSFFDTTPVGRIINRFGKDIDILDNSIPVSIRAWINCLFSVNKSIDPSQNLVCSCFESVFFVVPLACSVVLLWLLLSLLLFFSSAC